MRRGQMDPGAGRKVRAHMSQAGGGRSRVAGANMGDSWLCAHDAAESECESRDLCVPGTETDPVLAGIRPVSERGRGWGAVRARSAAGGADRKAQPGYFSCQVRSAAARRSRASTKAWFAYWLVRSPGSLRKS